MTGYYSRMTAKSYLMLLWASAVVALNGSVSAGEAGGLPEEAKQMCARYAEAVEALRVRRDEQHIALLRRYHHELSVLRDRAQRAGDLGRLQALMREQKRLEEEKSLTATAPEIADFNAIWDAWQDRRAQIEMQDARDAHSLAMRFHAAMEDLQRRLTQADHLASATAVMDYRQQFLASLPAAPPEMEEGALVPASPPDPGLEKDAAGCYPAEGVVAHADRYLRSTIDVVGVIRRMDRDGMAQDTLLIELEGGLHVRLALQPFRQMAQQRRQRLNVHARTLGDLGLYVGQQRFLSPGETLAVRGEMRQEMRRYVLDGVTVLRTTDPRAAGVLGVRQF